MIKANKTLAIAATSLTLIVTPLFSTAEAISVEKTKLSFIDSQQQEFEYMSLVREYKLKQQIIEQEKREAQIAKEEEIARQKKAKANFHYIVENTDLTRMDLRTKSGLTVEEANMILEGTGLEGLGQGFVDAEKKHGVNAYYLMAHAAWESSWGKSSLAVNKNNLFGFTAYDASPGSSATHFTSKEECIDIVAAYVKTHYLADNGQYHNGPNLQGMNVRYATDQAWAQGIAAVITSLVDKLEVPRG